MFLGVSDNLSDSTSIITLTRTEHESDDYNPHKPGRPSHSYHTYFIANLRLVLDVEVQAGNLHASKHSSPGLWALLERLGRENWPVFIRGDKDWGTEGNMARAEKEGLGYLFKLRLTARVKKLVERLMRGAE